MLPTYTHICPHCENRFKTKTRFADVCQNCAENLACADCGAFDDCDCTCGNKCRDCGDPCGSASQQPISTWQTLSSPLQDIYFSIQPEAKRLAAETASQSGTKHCMITSCLASPKKRFHRSVVECYPQATQK